MFCELVYNPGLVEGSNGKSRWNYRLLKYKVYCTASGVLRAETKQFFSPFLPIFDNLQDNTAGNEKMYVSKNGVSGGTVVSIISERVIS